MPIAHSNLDLILIYNIQITSYYTETPPPVLSMYAVLNQIFAFKDTIPRFNVCGMFL